MEGWIKLHRKLLDSLVFQNEKLLKVWIWCLCKSTHSNCEILVGMKKVNLEEGQFVFGRNVAATELKMNPNTVYRYMKMLEKMQMLNIKANNKFSVVTIVNWGIYQFEKIENNNKITTNEQQINNKITANEQQNNTYKNVKNVNNVKNSYIYFINLLKKERPVGFHAKVHWLNKIKDDSNYINLTEEEIRYLTNYVFSNGTMGGIK